MESPSGVGTISYDEIRPTVFDLSDYSKEMVM